MQYVLEFPVTRELVTKATRRFWIQYVGWSGVFRWAIGVITVVVMAWSRILSTLPWLTGILIAGVIGIPLLWIAGYVLFMRRAFYRFGQMKSAVVQYVFTEESIATRSDLGNAEVPWRMLDRVQQFPDVWLLYFGRTNYIYLPAEQLSSEVKAFILERAMKHHKKTN